MRVINDNKIDIADRAIDIGITHLVIFFSKAKGIGFHSGSNFTARFSGSTRLEANILSFLSTRST